MLARRFFFVAVPLLILGLAAATVGFGRSEGADVNWGNRGCDCHGASPNAEVVVSFSGIPEHWEHGTNYTVTVEAKSSNAAIPGPVGINAGGFAVDFSHGTVTPSDDKVQVKEKTVTHTGKGNDFRKWSFTWMSPTNASEVTFKVAVNAVNGDRFANQLDAWNKKGFAFETHPPEEESPAPASTTPPAETPTFGILGIVLAVGVALFGRLVHR